MRLGEIANILKLLTGKETEESERGLERYRRAFKTLTGTYLAQIVTILTGLVTTPLMLNYLGDERYGLMVSMTSLFFFFGYLDLGCGIGIQNGISDSYGKDDHNKATSYASSGFLFYISLAFVLVVLSLTIIPHLPLQHILKIKTVVAKRELLPAVLVLSIAMAIGLISTYVQRLCDSLQQGYLTRFAAVFSRIVSFSLILIGIHFMASLPVLISLYIMPSIASIFAWSILLKKYKWMRPRRSAINLTILKQIFGIGIQGLGAIIAFDLMLTTIPLIISNRIGAASVIHFSVANQLVMMAATFINTISIPFWPAIAEAMGRGDSQWVMRAFKRFFMISMLLAVCASAVFLTAGRFVISIWTHNNAAVPSWMLLISMSVLLILLVVNACLTTLLNGLNRFRGTSIYGLIVAFATLATAFLVGKTFGVVGISWIYTIGFAVRCICISSELYLVRRRGLFKSSFATETE